jgi:guanine nucleotide-binding protein subunit alpha
MRLIHRIPFAAHEIESYRQLIFENLTRGLKYLLDAMEDMELKVSAENFPYIELIDNATDLRDGEPFPMMYFEPLKSLWADSGVQKAWERGNEAALPEKYVHPSICLLSVK